MIGQTLVEAGLRPLSAGELEYWRRLPADQQPAWAVGPEIATRLGELPGLVDDTQIDALYARLAEVAAGRRQILQAGDCAEDPVDCVPSALAPKVRLLETLADVMTANTGLHTLTVGRIAGQFAKPRSMATEFCQGRRLPVFRGLMVNRPEPDPDLRRPDPARLLVCHDAALDAMTFLRDRSEVWTSHEALILDYELPMLRRAADGRLVLTSTHWPWIGDRTRQLDGAHVRLLAAVSNPIACKVGPTMTEPELVRLCERLDPHRRAGRLTLISRLGAGRSAERLPGLVAAVRRAGHPAIWMCDPMHANTVTAPSGLKTRVVEVIEQEVGEFCAAVGSPGGLHLEATPDAVAECVWDRSAVSRLAGDRYTTLCDPRLDEAQAMAVAGCWSAA